MIFSNDGFAQIGGKPMDNVLELSQILRTIRKRIKDSGGSDELADVMIVLAGKLSMVDEKQLHIFMNSLPKNTALEFSDILDRFEIFLNNINN